MAGSSPARDRLGRQVTIKDVAALAGVSPATVSHSLSGRRKISESTTQRIREAIDALGYAADPVATALRRGSTRLIGLVLRPRDAVQGSLQGAAGFLELMGTAAIASLEQGWGLVHVPNTASECDLSLPVDGYIVAHPFRDDPVLAQLHRARKPVVTIDGFDDQDDQYDVRIDHAHGVRELLGGLDHRAHTHTALVTGTEPNRWNEEVKKSVIEVFHEEGSQLDVISLYEGEGVQGARKLIEGLIHDGARRILVGPSRFALGALDASHSLGFAVPEEVEVAAFTDSPLAAHAQPGITAMDVQAAEAGKRAVENLLGQLSGSANEGRKIVPAVRWRGSTRGQVPEPGSPTTKPALRAPA
ncbi:LacI family DNA-binding transcriptional regulator [Microbacterium sp. WCS2018Hpa-9]|uniref:LacI family DNA-binding transcriptional regulator n=1 Tax=Microbacterium sp. WCS2018Hpa-9 TaxID=3073635 RepID=UPI00288C3FB8|nr:LacI family DNA-binding transcriptional regulator [Microbacterium sp. WCS2018Hpa-9]